MADAEGEPPTEVRASSSARATRPLPRVAPSDPTPPSAFGPIRQHRHRHRHGRFDTEAPIGSRARLLARWHVSCRARASP